MMARYRKICSALLAAALLLAALPAAWAADGPDAPGLSGIATDPGYLGLNGPEGSYDDFDRSLYAAQAGPAYIKDGAFQWPDSGTVLIPLGGTVVSTLKDMIQGMDGKTIPAGLTVDVYYLNSSAGSRFPVGYQLIATYDTTGGQPAVIDAGEMLEEFDYLFGTSMAGTSGDGQEEQEEREEPQPPAEYTYHFDDVQPGAWYYDAVMLMAENGIVQGYGGGRFGPDDPLTYQQLWTLLDRICNYEEVYDVWEVHGLNPWAQKIVSRGGAAYYMAGGKWSARLNEGHSYYDIVMRTRADHYINGTAIESIDEFPDGETIKTWSVEYAADYINDHPDTMDTVSHMSEMVQKAIANAFNYDLFTGVDGAGTFSPYAEMTRAQLCQALYRAGIWEKVS